MPHHGEQPAGAGGVTHYKRIVEPIGENDFGSFGALGAGRVYLRPFQLEFPMTLDRIAFFDSVAVGNATVGIYADNGDTPLGGAVIVQSASVPLVVGVQEVVIAATVLVGGLYWVALEISDVTGAARIFRTSSSTMIESNATLRHYSYDRAGGYGPLTDPCPALTIQDGYAIGQYLRVASVP